jgi:hypothetical protein
MMCLHYSLLEIEYKKKIKTPTLSNVGIVYYKKWLQALNWFKNMKAARLG